MPNPTPDPGRPPLGAWWRVYTLVAVLAVVVMLVLWYFTEACNIRMAAK